MIYAREKKSFLKQPQAFHHLQASKLIINTLNQRINPSHPTKNQKSPSPHSLKCISNATSQQLNGETQILQSSQSFQKENQQIFHNNQELQGTKLVNHNLKHSSILLLQKIFDITISSQHPNSLLKVQKDQIQALEQINQRLSAQLISIREFQDSETGQRKCFEMKSKSRAMKISKELEIEIEIEREDRYKMLKSGRKQEQSAERWREELRCLSHSYKTYVQESKELFLSNSMELLECKCEIAVELSPERICHRQQSLNSILTKNDHFIQQSHRLMKQLDHSSLHSLGDGESRFYNHEKEEEAHFIKTVNSEEFRSTKKGSQTDTDGYDVKINQFVTKSIEPNSLQIQSFEEEIYKLKLEKQYLIDRCSQLQSQNAHLQNQLQTYFDGISEQELIRAQIESMRVTIDQLKQQNCFLKARSESDSQGKTLPSLIETGSLKENEKMRKVVEDRVDNIEDVLKYLNHRDALPFHEFLIGYIQHYEKKISLLQDQYIFQKINHETLNTHTQLLRQLCQRLPNQDSIEISRLLKNEIENLQNFLETGKESEIEKNLRMIRCMSIGIDENSLTEINQELRHYVITLRGRMLVVREVEIEDGSSIIDNSLTEEEHF